MTNTKLTYAKAIELILAGEEMTAEIREKLEALHVSLTKKSASEKSMTAKQKENAPIKEAIFAHMSADPDRLFTITEIMKEVPECAELTNQRVSALVRQFIDTNQVERVSDTRKSYFRIVR